MEAADMTNKADFTGETIRESDSSITYIFSTERSGRQLTVPKLFVDRFLRDQNWQDSMFMKYAKTVKNKTSDWVNGCGASKPGAIPENEPFAITDYENVPRGHMKIRENEQYVYFCILLARGHGSEERRLAVPAKLWQKYSSDHKWCIDMCYKYGQPHLGKFPESDAPDEMFGFIPESEGDC
jgi:hypothetical protein